MQAGRSLGHLLLGQPVAPAEVSCGIAWLRLGNAQGWKFPHLSRYSMHLLMETLSLRPSLWFVLCPLVPSPTTEKSLALLSVCICLACP